MSFEEYIMEEFADGQNLGAYEASEDGAWENAAYTSKVSHDEQYGIEVIGDLSEDVLFMVETQEARQLDADVAGREYLDPAVEYQVEVEVVNRDQEVVDEGNATILSGQADQTSAEVWAHQAIDKALTDDDITYIEGGSREGAGNGELEFPLDEEESAGPAIDRI